MGREPSPEEVDNEVEQRRAELAPRPGETTGRVAQFGPQVGEPPPTNDFMNIRSATDVPAATENVQYWRDRLNASRLTGDPEIARHADDMLGVAERHLASLRGRAGIPLTELPVRGQFPDVGPADLPAQRGLPFGPAELRARTQLENISNAPPSEAVDLGPQPTQESFNFNKSPKELPPMGGSETGAIDFGGTLQAIREKTGIGGTPLTEKQLAAKKAQIARNKEAGYRPGTTAGDEVLGLAKSATTIADFSGMKQVASQWMTPEFRRGVLKMVGATFSDKFDNAIHAELQSKDMFQHELDANNNPLPSWADRVGFKLIGKGKDLGGRTEMIASNWMENGRFFGLPDNPVSRFYSKTYGNVARGSTRGFRTMINYVAANRLEFLANNAREMAIQGATTGKTPMPGIMGGVHLPKWMGGQRVGGFNQKVTLDQAMDLNPYTNIELGRHLSDFVRTATGQAPLKFHIYPGRGGEWNLEGHTRLLTRTLFAPRSLFQKFRMMNPNTYIMAPPMVRKEYMKAALSSIAGWIAITNMVKAASPAMGNNVRVSWNPDNSDFGKIRIGNTRLDFGQGYLPFLVMGYRWLTGHYTSSATGITHQYGQGFQAQTQLGQTGRTIVGNKLEPFLAFATDLMGATEQQPFHVGDRAMQLAIPMAAQDIWDIAHANPSLGPTGLGMIPPILAGAASQTYGRKSGPRFISGQHDLVIKHPSILGGFK
jgi:hypothetical protein